MFHCQQQREQPCVHNSLGYHRCDGHSIAEHICIALQVDSVATLLQFCTSRVEAISNKKMAVDSNLSLEQELL